MIVKVNDRERHREREDKEGERGEELSLHCCKLMNQIGAGMLMNKSLATKILNQTEDNTFRLLETKDLDDLLYRLV